jgi:hypothetical protein
MLPHSLFTKTPPRPFESRPAHGDGFSVATLARAWHKLPHRRFAKSMEREECQYPAAFAAFYLFRPQRDTGTWVRGTVAVVSDCRTFGFQPDGADYWFTTRIDGTEYEQGKILEVGQVVEVRPIEFGKSGVLRARVRR